MSNGEFQLFGGIEQTLGTSPESGSSEFQPGMFDMDSLAGKKVPCTQYHNFYCRPEKLNNQFFWLSRPWGILNNQSSFPSLVHVCDLSEQSMSDMMPIGKALAFMQWIKFDVVDAVSAVLNTLYLSPT